MADWEDLVHDLAGPPPRPQPVDARPHWDGKSPIFVPPTDGNVTPADNPWPKDDPAYMEWRRLAEEWIWDNQPSGIDHQDVEWVPTDYLHPMLSINRDTDGFPGRADKVLQSLHRVGFKNPIWVDFNDLTGQAYVSEGNHRLTVAHRGGIPAVPVRVYRSLRPPNDPAKTRPHRYVGDLKDHTGAPYVPQYMKPSDIGMPTTEPWHPPQRSVIASHWEPFTFPTGAQVHLNWETNQIRDPDGEEYDLDEWLRYGGSYRDSPSRYVEAPDFHKQFWDDPQYLFHGTDQENVAPILANGLEPRNKTRGIDNRSIGNAVFTTPHESVASYHYGPTLGIDAPRMKADGYMPVVTSDGMDEAFHRQAVAEALDNHFGTEYGYEYRPETGTGGEDPDTVVFHGHIPAKYITHIDDPTHYSGTDPAAVARVAGRLWPESTPHKRSYVKSADEEPLQCLDCGQPGVSVHDGFEWCAHCGQHYPEELRYATPHDWGSCPDCGEKKHESQCQSKQCRTQRLDILQPEAIPAGHPCAHCGSGSTYVGNQQYYGPLVGHCLSCDRMFNMPDASWQERPRPRPEWGPDRPNEDGQADPTWEEFWRGASVDLPRMAALTRAQRLQEAAMIEDYTGRDRSHVVHTFPDGWSIRRLTQFGDVHREGELMHNCWSMDHADNPWLTNMGEDARWGHGDPLPENTAHSLRDPDNLPHASFWYHPASGLDGGFGEVLGQHNSNPKDKYLAYLREFAIQRGHDPKQTELQLNPYVRGTETFDGEDDLATSNPGQKALFDPSAMPHKADYVQSAQNACAYCGDSLPHTGVNDPSHVCWSCLRDSQGGHKLRWEKGWPGKANLYADGRVHTWVTDEYGGDPHHSAMGAYLKDPQTRAAFYIEPDGTVAVPQWRYKQDPTAIDALLAAQPGTKPWAEQPPTMPHKSVYGSHSGEPWEPGHWGKGITTPDGRHHLWITTAPAAAGTPSHYEGYDMFADPPDEGDYPPVAGIVVSPSGHYTTDEVVTDAHRQYAARDPRLTFVADPGQWLRRHADSVTPHNGGYVESPRMGGETRDPSLGWGAWQPGRNGRGIVAEDGTVYHWQCEENFGFPVHDVWLDAHPEIVNRKVRARFTISPAGVVSEMRRSNPEMRASILATHPALSLHPAYKQAVWRPFYYHISPVENREAIRANGLTLPTSGSRYVWLFDDLALAERFQPKSWGGSRNNDIWRVNALGISPVPDPHGMDGAFVVDKPIPFENLDLLGPERSVASGVMNSVYRPDPEWFYHSTPAMNLDAIRSGGLASNYRARNDAEPHPDYPYPNEEDFSNEAEYDEALKDYDREAYPQEHLLYFDSQPDNWGDELSAHLRIHRDHLYGVGYPVEDRNRPGEYYLNGGEEELVIPPEHLEVQQGGRWMPLDNSTPRKSKTGAWEDLPPEGDEAIRCVHCGAGGAWIHPRYDEERAATGHFHCSKCNRDFHPDEDDIIRSWPTTGAALDSARMARAKRYYRLLPSSIREQVLAEGMVPNPATGNPMHFWDNLPEAQRYAEISNSLEPHDMWEVHPQAVGKLKRDPWFTQTRHDWGSTPGAWRSDVTHIAPQHLRLVDVTPPQNRAYEASGDATVMFHASPTVERQSILTNGLTPNAPLGGYPPGVYLFPDEGNALFFAEHMAQVEREGYGAEASGYDVWLVDTGGLTLLADPAVTDDDEFQQEYPAQPLRSVYTTQRVGPERLTLKGTPHNAHYDEALPQQHVAGYWDSFWQGGPSLHPGHAQFLDSDPSPPTTLSPTIAQRAGLRVAPPRTSFGDLSRGDKFTFSADGEVWTHNGCGSEAGWATGPTWAGDRRFGLHHPVHSVLRAGEEPAVLPESPPSGPPDVREPWEQTLHEFAADPRTMWHGTRWGTIGQGSLPVVHLGGWKAAHEALGARGSNDTAAMHPLRIVGPMHQNTWSDQHADVDGRAPGQNSAEGRMLGMFKRGIRPRQGFYYTNGGEGVQSINGRLVYDRSAIVPHPSWLKSHKDFVREALEQGKPVPEHVTAEYPELQRRTSAIRFEPLPMDNGLYYRAHPKKAPFGPEHATTVPIWTPEGEEFDKYREPKPGYSAFWNPHHLQQYMQQMGWDTHDRHVIAFRGKPVGEGSDGEPRVMPDTSKPLLRGSWKQFEDALEVTENGYGRWDEHTWGDGPHGQQVDDGYRSIRGDGYGRLVGTEPHRQGGSIDAEDDSEGDLPMTRRHGVSMAWFDHPSCLHCGSTDLSRSRVQGHPYKCNDCGKGFDPMHQPEFMRGERVIFHGFPSDRGKPWPYTHLPYRPGMQGTIEDADQNPANGGWLFKVRFRGIDTSPQPRMKIIDDVLGETREPDVPDERGMYDHANWFGANQIERAQELDETFPESWGFQSAVDPYEIRPADEGWFSADTGTFIPRRDRKGADTLETRHGQGDGRVAYFNGEPVASVTWQRTPQAILLGSAYTHPDHRGKGLFNRLTEEIRGSDLPVDAVHWDNPWLKRKVRDWRTAAAGYEAEVWHGTSHPSKLRVIKREGLCGPAWLTTDRALAESYGWNNDGTSNVVHGRVRLSNPWIIEEHDNPKERLAEVGLVPDEHQRLPKVLQGLGYDGFVHKKSPDMRDASDPRPAHHVVVAFDPQSQVSLDDDKEGDLRSGSVTPPEKGPYGSGVYYHGTLADRAQQIRANGFQPDPDTDELWFTSSEHEARSYQHRHDMTGKKPGATLAATLHYSNPFEFDRTVDQPEDYFTSRLQAAGVDPKEVFWTDALRAKGYDAILYHALDLRGQPRTNVQMWDPSLARLHESPEVTAGVRVAMPLVPAKLDALKQTRDAYVGRPENHFYNEEYRELSKTFTRDDWQRIREREREWDHAARYVMATGRMTPAQVVELGYKPSSHEGHGDWGEPKWGKWQPLPDALYHVTTNLPAVLKDGRLRSRYELDLTHGRGLGAGDDHTVSFTDDHQTAQDIYRAMLEASDVASGRLSIQRLVEMAEHGEGAREPWLRKIFGNHDWSKGNPRALDDLLLGRKPFYSHLLPDDHPLKGMSWMSHLPAEEWTKHGYHPREDAYAFGAPDNPVFLANDVYRTLTPEEQAREAFEWWRNPYAPMRQWSGGPQDPLFTGVDPHWFAALDSQHVGIIRAAPVPGAHGYPMGSLREWRVPTGDSVDITHVNGQPYERDPEHVGAIQANVLDPVRETLDRAVFEDPHALAPHLRPVLREWLLDTIFGILEHAGYEGTERWARLYLTGSLTTYQYADHSDCDISIFVNHHAFPEWSRGEMIGLMVESCDGLTLPGTPHELQVFVVAKSVEPSDLYKPGLRSGYDLIKGEWIVPPERDRAHDPELEDPEGYVNGLLAADKMDSLLTHEPDRAIDYYAQLHRKRMRDQRDGKGDYAPSNLIYKMMANRGLFDRLRELGVRVAAVAPEVAHLQPGTSIYRGEVRPSDAVASVAQTGVGMHWSLDPSVVVHPQHHGLADTNVVWHAVLDDPATQAIPRNHEMWRGRHRSMDWEAEARLWPKAQIALKGAHVWTGGDTRGLIRDWIWAEDARALAREGHDAAEIARQIKDNWDQYREPDKSYLRPPSPMDVEITVDRRPEVIQPYGMPDAYPGSFAPGHESHDPQWQHIPLDQTVEVRHRPLHDHIDYGYLDERLRTGAID